jgi:hypothetical protein
MGRGMPAHGDPTQAGKPRVASSGLKSDGTHPRTRAPVPVTQYPFQRHNEIGLAYFHEGSTADQLAEQFQLHLGTVRDFARDPEINSFGNRPFVVDPVQVGRPDDERSARQDALHPHLLPGAFALGMRDCSGSLRGTSCLR